MPKPYTSKLKKGIKTHNSGAKKAKENLDKLLKKSATKQKKKHQYY